MSNLQIKPIFVKSANVRNFEAMMRTLALSEGEGRFGLVWGRAGRGKTRTANYFVANNRNCHYLLALKVWQSSHGEFLRTLARELQMTAIPHRIGPLFAEVAERLAKTKPVVFVDEPDKLPLGFFEVMRDLTEASAAPFVLIGEEELPGIMRKERRLMSRAFQQVEFKPFAVADIVQYVTAAAGVRFTTPSAAEAMFKSSEGDIRIVKRDLINLVQALNAKGTAEADENTVKAAIRQALTVGE